MGEHELPSDIVALLEQACKKDYFTVKTEDNHGERGYIGEMVYIALTPKSTEDTIHLVLKQMPQVKASKSRELSDTTFFNEIHFYERIWPGLMKFQKSFLGDNLFNKVPKCYITSSTPFNEKLVLENLLYSGFELFPRSNTFNEGHLRYLMRFYGQYHGISASFREHFPDEFVKLTAPLLNSAEKVIKLDIISLYSKLCLKQMISWSENVEIKEKLKRYAEDGPEIACQSLMYSGKNPVLVHGDSWSNNMMFKFDTNGEIVDMRLVDFQQCRSGSVVSDLSYILYIATPKSTLNKLDEYLREYYDSFSNTLRRFNLDPTQIFTFEDLKTEWKNHNAYAVVMGVILTKNKLSSSHEKRNIMDVNETTDFTKINENSFIESCKQQQTDLERLKELYLGLAQHLYENDYL